MKLGMCYDLNKSQLLASAGFDYIESALTGMVSANEGDFQKTMEIVEASGLRAEVANLFLPGNLKLTGPDADPKAVEEYLSTCFDRAALLGVKIQVFGSGGARNVPEGCAIETAMAQLVQFLKSASKYAEKYGIKIAIEPLNKKECNIINTVSDAIALSDMVNNPNVGVLADWYHMRTDNEGFEGILAAKKKLLHCHIAKPEGRTYPLPDDGEDYSVFFEALKQIGYVGRISVEANGDEADFKKCYEKLRGYL